MDSNVLDLDVGNSYTKWRLGTQRGNVITGELPEFEAEIARVRVSAVAVPEAQLSQQIAEIYKVQPEFARTTKTLAGVSNGYDDFSKLGVDRWLALVAAWCQFRCDLLVCDLGTAMTADYVQANGTHLGGYIVPGPTTMRGTLGQSTRDVRVLTNKSSFSHLKPARNTDDAVHHGLAHIQLGWIKSCIEVGSHIFGEEPKLILTGRDLIHDRLCQLLPCRYCPDLVLEGLSLALP